jgi:hypothetical protein
MATEITARTERPAPATPDENDYETFCAALSASERGRAFLAEYTRRNRNADTEQLLAAIAALQKTVTANSAPTVTDTIKAELRALLDEIGAAQSELEASVVALKATKLAELVALVTRRVTAIMALAQAESLPPAEIPAPALPPRSEDEPEEAVERTHLVVVPKPDQPELPIPSPLVTPLPSIALVRSEAIMEEVIFVEPSPPNPGAKSAAVKTDSSKIEAAILPPAPAVADTKPVISANPLASIMALSEEERLALFT